MIFKGHALSVIGSREKNQDSYLVADELSLYAVADGIGGGYNGEVASKMAVEGLKAQFSPTKTLTETVRYLQASIYQEAMNNFGEPLMGTTFTAVHLTDLEATFCHVGDSRLYLYDGTILKQLTEDHEQYDENLKGTVLVSYLGLDINAFPLKIQEERFTVQPGNRLLLCSDGLYKQVEETRVAALIRENLQAPQILLEKLCTEASRAEYSDNITVVYIEID